MPQSIFNTLPADLAFLRPAVRRMLLVHKANRPPDDADMEPEERRDAELDASFDQDMEILGEALRGHFDPTDREAFIADVRAVQSRLMKWLKPHQRRPLTAETSLLFTLTGIMGYPEPFLERPRAAKPRARGARAPRAPKPRAPAAKTRAPKARGPKGRASKARARDSKKSR